MKVNESESKSKTKGGCDSKMKREKKTTETTEKKVNQLNLLHHQIHQMMILTLIGHKIQMI